ncbi:hypothetical protein LCGC14_1526110 [marine sediment metagenome]|uniref:Uncharacterized protein n=1 Tax=marine sediment metagenome TaxID=412755 RepID=A0A0F9JI40_9ZZZZ
MNIDLEKDSTFLQRLLDSTLNEIHIKSVSNGYVLSIDFTLPSYGSDRKEFVFCTSSDLFDAIQKILFIPLDSK